MPYIWLISEKCVRQFVVLIVVVLLIFIFLLRYHCYCNCVFLMFSFEAYFSVGHFSWLAVPLDDNNGKQLVGKLSFKFQI